MDDRYSHVAPGPYSITNPWGKVRPGGTQLCRFNELNDGLERDLRVQLAAAVSQVERLTGISRSGHLPAIQWIDDQFGAYWVGSGLRHEPDRPESEMVGWLWLSYLSDGPEGLNERPLDIELSALHARDAQYRVDLIIAAAKAHRRLMQTRALIPV